MNDFSPNDDVPRRRVDPFTEEEDHVMLTAIIDRRHIIDHRFSNGARISNAEKMAAWKEVTALVNAKGQIRDVSKIKVRYDNLAQVYRRYKLRKSDRKPSCYELLDWFNTQAKIEGGATGTARSPNNSRSGSPADSTLYEDRGRGGEHEDYQDLQTTNTSENMRLQNMTSYVDQLSVKTSNEEQLTGTNIRNKEIDDTWIKQENGEPDGEENMEFVLPSEIANVNKTVANEIPLNSDEFDDNNDEHMDSRDEPTPAEAAISAGIKRTQKSRAAIVALYESGVRRAEIANLLRVNKVLVWRTIKRFEMQKAGVRSAGQDRTVMMARRIVGNAISTCARLPPPNVGERNSGPKTNYNLYPAANATRFYPDNRTSNNQHQPENRHQTSSNQLSSNLDQLPKRFENGRLPNSVFNPPAGQSRATGMVNIGVSGVNEAALQKYIREVISQETDKSKTIESQKKEKDRTQNINENNFNLDMIENEFEEDLEDASHVSTTSRFKCLQIQVLEARLALLRHQIRNAQAERLNHDEKRENLLIERELLRDQQRNTRKRDSVTGNGSLQFQ